jgi:hypothetical protein
MPGGAPTSSTLLAIEYETTFVREVDMHPEERGQVSIDLTEETL